MKYLANVIFGVSDKWSVLGLAISGKCAPCK